MYKIDTYCEQGLEKFKTFLISIMLWGDFTQLFYELSLWLFFPFITIFCKYAIKL